MVELARARRTRRTPFSRKVEEAGVSRYSVYNHMLLPAAFESTEADYHHLKRHVQVWDVSCERQVEIAGPDASRLMQFLTPRDLSNVVPGRCVYVPVVDGHGRMLNDPVALPIGDDRWWISIADSDLLFWVKGIAQGMGLNVTVHEPDVSPLAVQGPHADDLMARVFGDTVRDIRFFRYDQFEFEGLSLPIARSGYSKQGGFEIYLTDGSKGEALWDTLMSAGQNLNVRAGCPNIIERVEGGLLSYGNDMTIENSPFECGLGKYCQVDKVTDCIGRDALLKEAASGPAREIRAVEIHGNPVPVCDGPWPLSVDGAPAGQVTSTVWSPDHETNVAIGMVEAAFWSPGQAMTVTTPDGDREATVQAGFWK